MITNNPEVNQEGQIENIAEAAPVLKKKTNIWLIVSGVAVLVIIAVFSVLFQDQLFTSVSTPFVFGVRVTPSRVYQGSSVLVRWPSNARNRSNYPFERISVCPVIKAKQIQCKVIVANTLNDGNEKLVANVDQGIYRIMLQALNANKNPINGAIMMSNAFSVVTAPGNGGGSNGGGGNGGSGNGGDSGPTNPYSPSTPTPTPTATPNSPY